MSQLFFGQTVPAALPVDQLVTSETYPGHQIDWGLVVESGSIMDHDWFGTLPDGRRIAKVRISRTTIPACVFRVESVDVEAT